MTHTANIDIVGSNLFYMEDGTDPVLMIAIFIILLIAAAVQRTYQTAVGSLDESDLEEAEKDSGQTETCRKIRKTADDPSEQGHSALFWLILSCVSGSVAAAVYTQSEPRRIICAAVLCLAVYLFGEALPGIAAKAHPMRYALRLERISSVLTALSCPFVRSLDFISSVPLRAAGIDPESLDDKVSEDEIRSMVNEGHEQGSIDQDEAEMITNIFELDDKQAQDIMTHRGDIIAIDAQTPLDRAIPFMVDAPNSRFPVYEESIDRIVGALYLKDAMAFHLKEKFSDTPVGKVPHLLRDVKFIPETVGIDDLFHQMQESRKQMAIVVDEYGQTSGLVTMEDILEEIVGNILDEYDKDERLIIKTGERRFRINGKALLEDVSGALGVEILSEDYDTLSGYLTERLGHIPTGADRGTVVDDPDTGYRFRILGINGSMIGWTEAQAPPPGSSEAAEAIRTETSRSHKER